MLRTLVNRFRPNDSKPSGLVIDRCAKFHRSLYVQGHCTRKVKSVRSLSQDVISASTELNGCQFSAQFLFSKEPTGKEVVELALEGAKSVRFVPMDEGAKDSGRAPGIAPTSLKFSNLLSKIESPKLLDIGGRARSEVDRSKDFPGVEVCVLDVLPGENVSIVGDAHMMSQLLPAESFDAVFSISVFEHIFMPWKVAIEMNAVMKPGAIGYIQSHQTVGMHDIPWDFWRYSDKAWDAIFNDYTGFRIIETDMFKSCYVLPFMLTEGKIDAEKACGFEGSGVLIEKTGPAKVKWDVPASILSTIYPA